MLPFFHREAENRTAVSAPTVTIRLAVADPVTAEDKPIFHRPPHLQKDLILTPSCREILRHGPQYSENQHDKSDPRQNRRVDEDTQKDEDNIQSQQSVVELVNAVSALQERCHAGTKIHNQPFSFTICSVPLLYRFCAQK